MFMYRRATHVGLAFIALLMGLAALRGEGLPAQAAQPSLPIRAAFYYPWYPETWGQGTHYHPQLGSYDSSDTTVIKQHIAWMKQAKIQAGIASWWGKGSQTDSRFPALEAAAKGTGFKWTAYYEAEGSGDPSQAAIAADLTYLKQTYVKNHPEWLRVGGKPVLFVYGDAGDGCSMVDRWLAANKGRFYLNLKVFPGYTSCAQQPSSWHQYAPAARADAQGSFSYSISPGFWFAPEGSPRLARDPAAFSSAVSAMVASGAQWQLITTFNEWGEGSSIEPATEWGSQYLDILAGSSSPSPTTTSPTPTSTSTTPPPPGGPVVVIFMENHERSSIVNSSSADYFNTLRSQGIDFTHYYGVTHPSLPNYLAFASGSTGGKVGTDSIRAGEIAGTTLWNQLESAGIPWSVLEESMGAPCNSPNTSLYQLKHNPATPFNSIFSNPGLCAHVTPYTSSSSLSPGVTFITPNMCNDMHDCSISTGDNWLQARVPAMLASGATVVLTFDEGDSGTQGGGNIYTVVAGNGVTPRVEAGTYNHYSLLRALEDRYGLSPLGGAGEATALPLR